MARDHVPSAGEAETFNVTLTTAGTEYSQSAPVAAQFLGKSVKTIQIQCATSNPIQYAFAPGGPYTTIRSGATYWKENLDLYNLVIYLKGTVDGVVAEIEVWY